MHSILAGFELILKGGFMMVPLLLSALVALTVVIERFVLFYRDYKTPVGLKPQIFDLLGRGEKGAAIKLCHESGTPVGAVMAAGLEHLASPVQEMELAMKNEAEEWIPVLERRIEVLDTVITAAPLMGLLGTITGMMASFRVLSEKGVNEPNAITGGVAEALIATATGLVIALLCLVAYNYLSTVIKNFIYEIESAASKLIELRMRLSRESK